MLTNSFEHGDMGHILTISLSSLGNGESGWSRLNPGSGGSVSCSFYEHCLHFLICKMGQNSTHLAEM